MSKKPESTSERLLRAVEQGLVRCLLSIVYPMACCCSVRGMRRVGDVVATAVYRLSGQRREMMVDNIRAVFDGEMTEKRARQIARSSVHNIAKTMAELIKMQWMDAEELDELVTIDGNEHLDAALEEGNGAILVTAHFGNWEWAGGKLAQMGYPINAIARAPYDALARKLIDGARESVGIQLFGREDARQILRAIKDNECVIILPDQHAAEGAVRTTFLGRPADTAVGPATFAARTGAPILPFFARRDDSDRVQCRILPAIRVPENDDREETVLKTTQRINNLIGEQIRRHPAQWLWLHNRWKADNGQ